MVFRSGEILPSKPPPNWRISSFSEEPSRLTLVTGIAVAPCDGTSAFALKPSAVFRMWKTMLSVPCPVSIAPCQVPSISVGAAGFGSGLGVYSR
jgi:hypothetical protein